MQKTKEEKREFYDRCSEILGIPHEYHNAVRRTRWTCRAPGNGKFPGFGLVQCFGSCVRVISRKTGTTVYYEYEKVFEALKNECTSSSL